MVCGVVCIQSAFKIRLLTETVVMSKFTCSEEVNNPTPKDVTEVLAMTSWRHRMRRADGISLL